METAKVDSEVTKNFDTEFDELKKEIDVLTYQVAICIFSLTLPILLVTGSLVLFSFAVISAATSINLMMIGLISFLILGLIVINPLWKRDDVQAKIDDLFKKLVSPTSDSNDDERISIFKKYGEHCKKLDLDGMEDTKIMSIVSWCPNLERFYFPLSDM